MFGKKPYRLVYPSGMSKSDRRRTKRIVSKAMRMKISEEEARRLLEGKPVGYVVPIDKDSPEYFDTTAFEDESGDLGRSPDSTDQLASAIIVTEVPEYFDYVVQSYPKNTIGLRGMDDEHKFINSEPWVREGLLKDAIMVDPRIYAYVVDKRLEDGSIPRHGSPLYALTVAEAARMMAENEDGKVGLIFDQHTALNESKAKGICRYATTKGNAHVICADHQGVSKLRPGLQIADIAAGSARHRTKKELPPDEREHYWRYIKDHAKMEKR